LGIITQRVKKDGKPTYTAQIRLRRNGAVVYQETQTFDRKAMARAWLTRREAEPASPGRTETVSTHWYGKLLLSRESTGLSGPRNWPFLHLSNRLIGCQAVSG